MQVHAILPPHKLTIGIASMSRKINTTQDYLMITLNKLFEYLNENEKPFVRIVVALTDNDTNIVQRRILKLHNKFKDEIDDGILHVISPSSNIYPKFKNIGLKESGQRLPYGNSLRRSIWQAKLSLDFAFLFSYCNQIQSDYFLNLEDDVIPINSTFVHDILSYVADQNINYPYWNSLIFSDWLSIGRLYRTKYLKNLVDMILISYEKQPVDFIMHHFEVIQMADKFREFRRKPSLLRHIGDVSTIEDDPSAKKRYNIKMNQLKHHNPPAVISTNISQWQGYTINNAYFPTNKSEAYFWGRKFSDGDIIDITLDKISNIKGIRMVTGFGKDHERAGEDRLIQGAIMTGLESRISSESTDNSVLNKHTCVKFQTIKNQEMNSKTGTIEYKVGNKDTRKVLKRVKCIRFVIQKGQSDWLLVRLINIKIAHIRVP